MSYLCLKGTHGILKDLFSKTYFPIINLCICKCPAVIQSVKQSAVWVKMYNGFKVHITILQVKVAISTKARGQSHASA